MQMMQQSDCYTYNNASPIFDNGKRNLKAPDS
jgi:hypothetical protein